jgi:enoyl-CoA hydratase/carnithine racemase
MMGAGIDIAWQDQPGRIATVWLDNRAKLNILGPELMDSLVAALAALAEQPGLRAVVLRGAGGRAFIGGADIGVMAGLDPESARVFIRRIHACCAALRALPVPVIACIEGFCLGAGLEIAAACDLRIARDESRFGMPEVRVGIPSVVEAALLPQLIGWGRTRWLLMTGEVIGTAEALAWGLIERAAPADGLAAALEQTLASLCAGGPRALTLQKRLMVAWEDLPISAAITRGIDAFADAYRTEEPAERMGAFLAAQAARKRSQGGG